MCSQSVSGSSLLSGYDEDDARETSGRSRREFDQIDAVLYNEETPKRSSIKRICDEWSSKPHFRVRGRLISIYPDVNLKRLESLATNLSLTSSFDVQSNNFKVSSLNSNELNVLLDETTSGRSSIDSIEGSEITNNSDLDDDDDDLDDATNTYQGDRFSSGANGDSFDTDEDEDENADNRSDISIRDRRRRPQFFIKCMKDSIINCLTTSLFQQFLLDRQVLIQRYARYLYARNSVKLRPKLRPSSLPPRSLSQNRLSLPIASSIASSNISSQMPHPMLLISSPFRATPEPNMKLTSLLRVTPLRVSNSIPMPNVPASPRKSQVSVPGSSAMTVSVERTSTSLAIDKRNQQQQISLIGTAVSNLPLPLTLSTPQPSQTPTRPIQPTWRFRSATTINSNIQNSDSVPRLPPITIERLLSSDQLMINRSNTIAAAIVESVPSATRAVSGTSTGSNLSSTTKLRTLNNTGKLQRTSRPVTISSNKDLNNSSSTSPARSITTTTTLKSTPITRAHPSQQQQQQKRPLVSTKGPPPPPPANVIKVPASH